MYRMQCLLVLVLVQVQVDVHHVSLFIYVRSKRFGTYTYIPVLVLPDERNTFKVYCVFIVFTSSTVPCTCNRSE